MNRLIAPIRENPFAWLSFFLMIGIALSRAIYVNSTDTFWQIRFGIDTIDSGYISHYDVYSWTMQGTEYTSNSWLWNVLLGAAYKMGGFGSVAFLTFVIVAMIIALMILLVRKNHIAWGGIFVGIAIFGLFSNMWLTARPQLIDYLSILSILLVAKFLDFKTTKGLTVGAITLFLIIALWQNFHLSAPLGVVIIFFVVLDNLLADGESKLIYPRTLIAPVFKAGVVTLFTALGCMLTPYGFDGLVKGLDTSGASVGVIAEWMNPISVFTEIGWYSVVSIILGAVALVQIWKTKRPAYFLLLVLLIILTSQQNRWSAFLAILSMVPVLQFLATFTYHNMVSKLRPYLLTSAVATALIFAAIGSLSLVPHDALSGAKAGYTVAPHLPADCKLFNSDVSGGPIMLFRPDIKVSTDSRNDLYGREKFVYYASLGSNDSQEALRWLEEQKITCVVTDPERSLDQVLENTSKWSMTYEDPDGSKVFLKEK